MAASRTDPFHAVSDPNRREILTMIAGEKMSINHIADNFNISRPAVSKHVKVLHDAGFILIQTKGKERICELKAEGFEELKQWITFFEQYWIGRLNKLENLLDSKKNKGRV